MEDHHIVLINGEPTARIELTANDWEVTGGKISDSDLQDWRRLRANS